MLCPRGGFAAVLTIAALALAPSLAACSHSRSAGGGIDADDDDGDGGSDDGDASASDASGDGNGGDGDAAATDGRSPDGPRPDAATDAPTDAPTDANGCIMQPCDYHAPQCGCADPLVCDIDFTDLVGSSCRAVTQPGNAQSTCASFSQCAGGFTCVMAGGGQRCEQFCQTDLECPQPRAKCAIQITNQQGVPIIGATTCSSNCNPLLATLGGACPAGWRCGFYTVNNVDIVDCGAPGAGVHGSVCNTDADCGAGMMCSTYDMMKRCRRVCNVGAGGQECATVPGTTCLGFNPALTIAGTTYGICTP
jgi:hypothetical protein